MSAILKKRVPSTKWETNLGTMARIFVFIAVSLTTSLAVFAADTPVTDITTEYVVVEAPNSTGTALEPVIANEPEFIVEPNTPAIKLDEICKKAVDRKTVVNALESGVMPDEIADVYATCSPPVKPVFKSDEPDAEIEEVSAEVRTRAKLGLTFTPAIPIGSIVYEKLKNCGYHPQRQEFDCMVEQSQRHGYGGSPGSFEWVKVCVYYPTSGWDIVNTSAGHVHNESYGVNPPWNYGVVVPADPTLHRQLMAGHTLYARAILSWSYPIPTNKACNPYWWWWWGNVIKFKIKLDP
ncbi:hypothetical protein [Candidatus Parabeggiatoa sp. HSG14]|uniref:hypothetical protein n=1 Tax=Candidatus Parabeggiatoa sp. HSG14 TaxID=3055593 RepID=UPI0025A7175B|nr:hypothetical protein [Thiotrichales bacterium HSG14]